MPVQHEATTPAETAACRASSTPCAACRKRGGEALVQGVVHAYGSAPRSGWVPRYATGETPGTVATFGIELETQRLPSRDRLALTGAEAAAVSQPRGHWHAAQDGSVDGPEFASQPATLAYWRSIAGNVGAFMRTLIHGGLRSHDGAYSCSMHVNVGRDAFTDDAHLARFIRLATVNPRFTTRMAQRTHAQVASWARFDRFPDMAACEAAARRFWTDGADYYAGHTDAVNLGNNGRVEFRSPRGTLRLDRFMAKLEWVAAMVEYTRDASHRPVPGTFTEWVLARPTEFPEFIAMMADLTPGRVAPRPARPARTTRRTSAADALTTDADGSAWTVADDQCERCGAAWADHRGTSRTCLTYRTSGTP